MAMSKETSDKEEEVDKEDGHEQGNKWQRGRSGQRGRLWASAHQLDQGGPVHRPWSTLTSPFSFEEMKICANRSALESDFVRSRQMLWPQYPPPQKKSSNNNKTKIKTKLSASVVKQNQNTQKAQMNADFIPFVSSLLEKWIYPANLDIFCTVSFKSDTVTKQVNIITCK